LPSDDESIEAHRAQRLAGRAEKEARRAEKAAGKAKPATGAEKPAGEDEPFDKTARSVDRELQALASELVRIRRAHIVRVTQPLVLIAQPNRSGGTLLSQLFDGHPQLHVHPWELEIGGRWDLWPELDLTSGPDAWHRALYERHTRRAFEDGYSKDKSSLKTGHNEQERFPFMLPPRLLQRLFDVLAEDWPVATQRDILALHFTSYFNAWLDNQNLYGEPKQWLVGFRGRMRKPENLVRFFRDYPDGRHITILRDPKGNIASRLKYRPRDDQEASIERATRAWERATELQLDAKRRYGDRMFLITFERLITDTEGTMRALAQWLGIRFEPILTEPTFNRLPIRASSHFKVESPGVITEPLEHWRKVLTDDQGAAIDRATAGLYERFATHAADDLARLA
jgi:hypothetical protein